MKYNKQHFLVKFGIYTLSETMDKCPAPKHTANSYLIKNQKTL